MVCLELARLSARHRLLVVVLDMSSLDLMDFPVSPTHLLTTTTMIGMDEDSKTRNEAKETPPFILLFLF